MTLKKNRKPKFLENKNVLQRLKLCLHRYITHVGRLNINSSSYVSFSTTITPTTLYLLMTLSKPKVPKHLLLLPCNFQSTSLCLITCRATDREILGFP
jgi:hypothetical protein